MTFEQLAIANQSLDTTPIRGKDYVMVNQRIKAFRMLYPNGSIETEIMVLEDGMAVIKATVKDDFGRVLGTGLAYEREGSTQINKTSYIENCETSAVGRALGMVGIGIDVSVASAEEMENAIQQQNEMTPVTKPQIATLETCIPKHGQTVQRVCEVYGVKDLSELNVVQFMDLMNRMGEK